MPDVACRLVRAGQHHGPGPVAEQDAGAAVRVVQEPGQQLRADDQRVLRHAGRDVGARGRVRVDEPGAGGRDVERGGLRVADGLLDERRRRGHPVVRRERGQDDQVDVVGLEARGVDRAQRRRPRAMEAVVSLRRRHAPLADAGAGDDPLVGGVDHPLEVGVGEHLGGGVAAPAREADGAVSRGRHAGSTSMSGCLAFTSAPLSAQTRTTRPARSLLISLNSFIASMRPMIWPTATWSPTAT